MVISNKKNLFIIFSIFIFMILIILIYFFKVYNSNDTFIESENILENITTDTEVISNNSQNSINSTNPDDIIIVHITGAIHNPGIVKLPSGSRIADAVNLSGGFTEESDISAVNLAYKLDDGEKIYIPFLNDTKNTPYVSSDAGEQVLIDESSLNNSSTKTFTTKNDLININLATQTELETIPGIGPSTALKIIEYRTQNGKFNDISELKNINRNW